MLGGCASPSGRPTLYVNLEIEGLILPRRNATYDPTVLIEAWEGYHFGSGQTS